MLSLADLEGLSSKRTSSARADEVERVYVDGSISGPTYAEIFTERIWANQPFLLVGNPCVDATGQSWKAVDCWVDGSSINTDALIHLYGNDVVPVAICDEKRFDDHPKTEMTLREYLTGMQSRSTCLYLKDYHFRRLHPEADVYTCPKYFLSDWLNEYCCDKGFDDYKFVYIGPKGSWTPFHADVLRSYSWSANVCGSKKWIIYPAGCEDELKDGLGKLPFDVSIPPYTGADHPSHRHRLEVVQRAGEIIFIPSGWHHQVHNLEETISINHNWFNGCNVGLCWIYLQQSLRQVENEISDCSDMEGWSEHCQTVLRAYLGFNYQDFVLILLHIATKRMQSDCHRQVDGRPFDGRQVGDRPVDEGHTIFDLRQISLVLREMTGTQQLPAADITNAQEILTSIDSFLDEKLE